MQKLTYINLNNEQAVFCGAPYVLSKIGGLGLPELEFQSIRGAYQQGDTALSFRRLKRMLSVTLQHYGGQPRGNVPAADGAAGRSVAGQGGAG